MNREQPKGANKSDSALAVGPRRPAVRDDIGSVTTVFVREIDSLADTFPLAMHTISEAFAAANQDLMGFVERHSRDESVQRHDVLSDEVLRFQKLQRRVYSVSAAQALMPRSFFITLVSQYDAFLGLLIEALLLMKPEVLNASEKTLSFSQLVSFGSVEAARDHIIEKEVESVLRKSHTEQFGWLEKTFQVPLRAGLSVWPRFVELTERRNLFVHTGGRVSHQYLHNCRTRGVDCSKVVPGEILSITEAYYNSAYEVIIEVGVKLAHVLWRKLRPDDLMDADKHLNAVTYALLVEEVCSLARTLLDFATEVLKKHPSEDQRLKFVINRVLAYKSSGDSDRARQILDQEDFSALSDQFRLAEAVLRDDFQSAVDLVRRIGRAGLGTLGTYRDWPLYRDLRKQAEFHAAVAEVFGEPLNKIEIPPLASSTSVP